MMFIQIEDIAPLRENWLIVAGTCIESEAIIHQRPQHCPRGALESGRGGLPGRPLHCRRRPPAQVVVVPSVH